MRDAVPMKDHADVFDCRAAPSCEFGVAWGDSVAVRQALAAADHHPMRWVLRGGLLVGVDGERATDHMTGSSQSRGRRAMIIGDQVQRADPVVRAPTIPVAELVEPPQHVGLVGMNRHLHSLGRSRGRDNERCLQLGTRVVAARFPIEVDSPVLPSKRLLTASRESYNQADGCFGCGRVTRSTPIRVNPASATA